MTGAVCNTFKMPWRPPVSLIQFPHSFPADVGLGLSLRFLFDTLVVDTIFGKFRGFRNSMGTLLEVSSSFPKISLINFPSRLVTKT